MRVENEENPALVTGRTAYALCVMFLISMVALAVLRSPHETTLADRSTHAVDLVIIDPNTARWYELAQLPGIGETIAKRIVAHRAALAAQGQDRAFHSAADLDAVQGIGRRTVDRIAPLLTFDPLSKS